MNTIKEEKYLAAKEAVKYVDNGQIIGLGTGSTAYFAIAEIGEMVKNGLEIKAVPTSKQTENQARSLGIELVSIDDVDSIDVTIDGTDEFDENLNLIKGGGGALLKEKMVANITKKQIIIADSSKKVDVLGVFMIPVEVLPFTVNYVRQRISEIGGVGNIRIKDGNHFLTDEKNYIIDADFGEIENPHEVSEKLNNIEGVVCNGLFLDLADLVLMGIGEETVVFKK